MSAPHDTRKLLELAAKAAGVASDGLGRCHDYDRDAPWMPHTDDGDALRLEIALKFTAAWEPMRSEWNIGGIVAGEFKWLASHEDRKLATTMAAATIGEAMP